MKKGIKASVVTRYSENYKRFNVENAIHDFAEAKWTADAPADPPRRHSENEQVEVETKNRDGALTME